LDLFRKQK